MKSLLIVCFFFTISFTGNSQSFEVWGSAGAKYKLNKKIHELSIYTRYIHRVDYPEIAEAMIYFAQKYIE